MVLTSRISLFFLLFLALVGCSSQRTIVNGLEEREANEIMVFLSSKNIEVTKVPAKDTGAGGGVKIQLYDIAVDSSKATEAMSLLNAAGLPRRRSQSLLNLFSAGGLVPSEMQEKIRFQAGLAEQIASTIRKIDGVLEADVQLSFPEEDPLNPQAQKGKITASVYVKHNGVLDDPNSHLIAKIKRLVSSSIAGLNYDDVTVIGDRSRFAENALEPQRGGALGEKFEYVRVWSIIVAKQSLTRFQIFFFSFCVVIVLLTLVVLWLGWKIYPLAKNRGGLKTLLHIAPMHDEVKPKAEGDKDAKEKTKDDDKEGGAGPKQPPKAGDTGPKVQENVETP
ncbi:MAG TPA: type III secretion inner membrane ring lipoprotein SctJ [Chlamydiales bacterium]|nr:type III secretion inner membrane ring lipoprotein SctJ [Chlamydiales bacterium]